MRALSICCWFGLVLLPAALCGQSAAARPVSFTLPEAPTPQQSGQTAQSSQQGTPSSRQEPAPQPPAQEQQEGSVPPGQTPAPAKKPAQPPEANEGEGAQDQLKNEEKQRMLGIMPAFNAVESGEAGPITSRQKFDLWYHSAVDPFTFATAGLDAGIEQAENSYPEYHQGFVGFAKRYGAAYADNVDGNFWGNAVLPSLLHQDPRYFRLGHGSAKSRLWYAVISTVRCKGDNGKWQPSYSNVGGNLIGGALSNLYYPASDRGVGLTLERGFTVTAEGAFGSIAFEFYPDAIAYLKRRHHKNVGPSVPASTAPKAAAPQG